MKRSEMVQVMLDADSEPGMAFTSLHKVYSHILLRMEEAGILPPTIECEDWVDSGNGQGFTIYEKNEWESEDD